MPSPLGAIAVFAVLLLAPCGPTAQPAPAVSHGAEATGLADEGTPAAEGTPAEGTPGEDDTARGTDQHADQTVSGNTATEDDTPGEPDTTAAPVVLQRRPLSLVSEIDDRVAEHIRTIARVGRGDPRVFAKMGGSSVESRAYLHCLARDQNLDLGAHENLRDALMYFREGRAARRSPFSRESLSAQVGWSLRQGLAGRPSRAIQEVRAINARWALTFWGGNDVQGRNPRRYAERLLSLIDDLERRGVVPLLAATTPRADDEGMDLWARRYNRVTRGLAEALALPYVDFYAAIVDLPNHGLAGDGVHPNVHLVDGRSRPCDFTEAGLRRGQNQRNLRTLQLLDAVYPVLAEGTQESSTESAAEDTTENAAESATVEDPPAGTSAMERALPSEVVTPYGLDAVPTGIRVEASSQSLDGYSCEGMAAAPGPEQVLHIRTDTSIALEFDVYAGSATLAYLGNQPRADQCISHGTDRLATVLEPGDHYIAIEVDNVEDTPILIVGEPIL